MKKILLYVMSLTCLSLFLILVSDINRNSKDIYIFPESVEINSLIGKVTEIKTDKSVIVKTTDSSGDIKSGENVLVKFKDIFIDDKNLPEDEIYYADAFEKGDILSVYFNETTKENGYKCITSDIVRKIV